MVGGASSPETEPFYLEEQEEWTLVWADEFNGSSVDAANWTFQTGDGTDYGLPEPGWGNGERQFYLEDNAAVADGSLVITAKEEPMGGMPYTSSACALSASSISHTAALKCVRRPLQARAFGQRSG